MGNYYRLDPVKQRRVSAERLFRYLRDYVYPFHPYLRRTYSDAGVNLSRLRTPDDVARLPITDKSHLQSDPQLFILRPRVPGGIGLPKVYETEPLRKADLLRYFIQTIICSPRDESRLVRCPTLREQMRRRGLLEWQPIHYHLSSGHSGTPTPITYSHYDLTHALAELAKILPAPNLRDTSRFYFDWSDRIMNVFPGAPHLAFFSAVLSKYLAGISTFETFGGAIIPTDKQITAFASGGFCTLAAIPSYLVHWLRRAAALLEEGRIQPLKQLKSVILGGEPVSEPLRASIRRLAIGLGASPRFTILQTLGMTEMKWVGTECSEDSGIHLNPKYFFWELLHPKTRAPVAEGEPGVLVFSHIGWRGTVLIRYWTGDLIKGGFRWDRCRMCGYTFPRVYPPICRAEDDFTKLKGTRVDLSLLIETVRDTPGVRQFQIILDSEDSSSSEFSRDLLSIHVAPESGICNEGIENRLCERVKTATEVTPDRIVFERDEVALEKRLFAKNGIKAEYLLERRPHRL